MAIDPFDLDPIVSQTDPNAASDRLDIERYI